MAVKETPTVSLLSVTGVFAASPILAAYLSLAEENDLTWS